VWLLLRVAGQCELPRAERELGDAQLAVDVPEMELHRPRLDEQRGGDLRDGVALGTERDYVFFTRA
jgi:hypothetical protein